MNASFSPLFFASQVAQALGPDWSAAPAYNEPRQDSPALLFRNDGLKLWVGEEYKNRVQISLSRPRDGKGQWLSVYAPNGARIDDPSIGVGSSKAPALVAKDIARRLLPDAERVLALALKAIEASDSYAAKQALANDAAQKAADVLRDRGVYPHAEGTEVAFNVRVSPDRAGAFANLLATSGML
jgi:hypothetical protein